MRDETDAPDESFDDPEHSAPSEASDRIPTEAARTEAGATEAMPTEAVPTEAMPTEASGAGAPEASAPTPAEASASTAASDEPAAAEASAPAGALTRITAFARRHRTPLAFATGALAFALLGAGAVALGAATVQPEHAEPAALASVEPTPTATVRPTPATAVAPARIRIRTCSVADRAGDPRLANLQAQVVNAATGEVLFDRGGETPSRTASVMKVLTSAAALSALGPDFRTPTTVVKGAGPGSVVLVGGGDTTLSRTPSGTETVYPGAAHLDDLAAQVRAAWDADPSNPPLTKLILDSSYFGGAAWHDSWDPVEREDGYMAPVTALMVDGDRDDPTSNTSWRSEDPVARAGDAFASALGGIQVIERGTAPGGTAQLGQVFSPTVAQLVDKALIVSDNNVAEMLARLVAIQTGAGNTFEAINAGLLQGLAGYGVDTAGITIIDGSGLSDFNAVPPSYLTRLFVKVNAREGNLGALMDGLPIAGGPRGSLSYSDRFTGDNAVADGAVFAKTGWIETGYTLSGIIHAQDGTTLTFAIYALGDVSDDAKQAIDTLTTGFFLCGDGLANT